MTEQGAYGSRIGRHFRVDDAPALVSMTLRKLRIAVTRLRCDGPHLGMTTPIPQEKAFSILKKAFTTTPILSYFDLSRFMILEVDASNFALKEVPSQVDKDDLLHPVAFHNRKFNSIEVNYEIYDREMLIIIECMKK